MAISAFHLPPLSTTTHLSSSFKLPFPNPRIPHPWRPSRLPTPSSAPTQPFTPAPTLDPKSRLLSLISDQDRGLKTQQNPSKQAEIIGAIDELAAIGKDRVTTDSSLSGTWRMLWTTEKEQLYIIKNASWFGTQTGDVLQVIDVGNGVLNNVITFPPSGVFFVRSTMEPVPPQRVNFRYNFFLLFFNCFL